MLQDNLTALMILDATAGIGPKTIQKLLEKLGNAEKVLAASKTELQNIGLNETKINSILKTKNTELQERIKQDLKKNDFVAIPFYDVEYSKALSEIYDHPTILYCKGNTDLLRTRCCAVVGSRRMTEYGKKVTNEIIDVLCQNNITVVSGLALGIDGQAHKRALENNGKTIAVLGTHIRSIHPTSHFHLFKEIEKKGLLLSEFSLYKPFHPKNFVQRNRIISGLSQATIIIEAAKKSGALITAYQALEQNRDVMAVPGNIDRPQSFGTNTLIAKGAKIYQDPNDLIELLSLKEQSQNNKKEYIPENDDEKKIYHCIQSESKHINTITRETQLPFQKVSSIVSLLEIKNVIEDKGSQVYKVKSL